jgi:uncharacterized iron-regulated protein
MINDKMTAAMTLVQRAKDAEMAEALRGSAQVNTHVLVAGSGHVRNDRGVPFYFRKRMAGKKLVAITWAEVLPGIEDAKAYAAQWGAQQLPFDYVWFTPRMDRPDPCEGFRQHMKAKNQTKN